ncbi:hypothetical protein [Phascolarctobacterium succinatutens]|uniref:hypothetical protein n=1 Tax=Phascolarctobacterium succinatutens TaxID=626940 RepID=UPI0026EAB47C|nr:hypothetical protein [Phascolarctobacterium succinatutens]
MANLIPEIAKMLGVELGEEFKVRSIFEGSPNNKIYHFGTKELFYTHEKNQNKIKDEYTLTELINGDAEIVKLPWKPKAGDEYYSFGCAREEWFVRKQQWTNHPLDLALLDKGWVFRTKEEAQAALPKVAKEMGVEYEL